MKLNQVTETELSILQRIWDNGESTSREIAAALYDEVTDSKLSSVQKLLERLEAKGCIDRDRSQRAHRFRSLVTRDEFVEHQLQALADRVCGGSMAPLMSTLLHSKGISHREQKQLREMIDQLWPAGRSSSRETEQ